MVDGLGWSGPWPLTMGRSDQLHLLQEEAPWDRTWGVRTRLPERFGELCRVLVKGGRQTALIEFKDGFKVTTSWRYTRLIKPGKVEGS